MKNSIYNYLKIHPPAFELFKELEKAGNLYLIGGVLREYRDNGDILNLRDVDIVLELKNLIVWDEILSNYKTVKNRFDGYKIICSGLVVDIWLLNETWAYREGVVKCSPNDYVKRLVDTVFLNIDSIVYDMSRHIWYDNKYREAMKSGILDIVLDKNPQIPLNIVRAIVLKNRYSMEFSNSLKNVIIKYISFNQNYLADLMAIQMNRYKKEIVSESDIIKAINGK